ncbi:hypothetical protein NLJ89_g5991 [Agrocybe chaxingu]|uniref:ATP-dependent RNA helicase n=1 Tax=Agrocybe chaxingu TaxID=84603 RepID=A0A9W8MUH9_9AGAR|nr:hypothetical protein NLJ89_g5991 [Agrocybe chaxingu]
MSLPTTTPVPGVLNGASVPSHRPSRGGHRGGPRRGRGARPLGALRDGLPSPSGHQHGLRDVLGSPTGVSRGMATAATRPVAKVHIAQVERSATPSPTGTIGRHFSDKTFADAPISNASKAGIKHKFLSDVQAATLDAALSGKDLLVQAKTGTGKTIAFLLPAIERLLKAPAATRQGISILVLAPTRELALQIEKEAHMLLAHHPFKVQHVIGGTNVNTESTRVLSSPCDILIATPGRLLDHLRSSTLPSKLSGLKTIVYDEADRLLDQGFKNDLDAILTFLPPKETRQALLFSATISQEIKKVVAGALKPGYTFVSTLLEDEANTHEHVNQTFIISPQASFLQTALDVLQADLISHRSSSTSESTSKCMVFFPTARQVSFAAEVLSQLPGLPPILEIHSRKSQAARTKAAEAFKKATSAVLLSSDVAARGMDFPGVTLVLQVGLPASADQYIHRLGRTGRAGAGGRGIIVLSPEEEFFLRTAAVRALPLKLATPPSSSSSSNPSSSLSPALTQAIAKVSPETKAQAYRAFLGYYNAYTKPMKMTKAQLVETAWVYAVGALGWEKAKGPPSLEAKTVGEDGVEGCTGAGY